MAENTNRPTSARLYQSPGDSGTRPGANYIPPGVPNSREPEPTLGVRRNPQAHTTEPASAPPGRRAKEDPAHSHPVGAVVEHHKSGQRGQVVGHRANGYGQAVPQVTWAGEEKSWPQGVSANALRVVGSTPDDLYVGSQGADTRRPMRGSTTP